MEYIIVMDSCGERTLQMKQDERVIPAPLTLEVDGEFTMDDETFNQAEFIQKMAQSVNCPKSACPSPDYYKKAFEKSSSRAYAVTLSAELSGSYNSALLAKEMTLEEHPELQIHVFNSRSASIGETLITQKIQECEAEGMEFAALVETVEAYIDSQVTYFVLESLDNLRKNGRLSNVKAFLATALKVKPVMSSTPEGNIQQLDQARGINKALVKMVEIAVAAEKHPEKKVLAISHCNCKERAEMVKEAFLKRINVKDVIMLDTSGTSSLYANDGGIIAVL